MDDRGKVVGGYTPREPNNWGRWGEDDQRGTQNLIGPEQRVAAAQLVKTGKIFALGLPLTPDAPVWPPRPAPQRLATMTGSDAVVGSPANAPAPGFQWSDDILTVATHGSTHWDGLAHAMCEDSLYNGFWAGNVTALAGWSACSASSSSGTASSVAECSSTSLATRASRRARLAR